MYLEREIMLFIGKPKGRSMMISNMYLYIYTFVICRQKDKENSAASCVMRYTIEKWNNRA